MYRPNEDKNFMSKSEMEETIISMLGGRVAEELVINDISTGASNDIERASKIAREMVTRYGMSDKLGAINYGSNQDGEIKKIVDKAYQTAKYILNEHMDKLNIVAERLLEKEKIEAEEFEQIFEN